MALACHLDKNNQFWPRCSLGFIIKQDQFTMSKKIKSQTIYRVFHIPGEEETVTPDDGSKYSFREFDIQGNTTLEMTYSQDGDIHEKTEYHYDDKGLINESIIYGEEDEALERRTIDKDDKGNIISETIHYLDGSCDKISYIFNEAGKLVERITTNDDDEIEAREKFYFTDDIPTKLEKYNEEGKLIYTQDDIVENGKLKERKIWTSEDGEILTRITKFNEAGQRESELIYDNQDKLIERNNYELDENGRIVKITEENRQKKNVTILSYDDAGRITSQEETDLNDDLVSSIDRIYDEDGQLKSATVTAYIPVTRIYQTYTLIYEYDFFED